VPLVTCWGQRVHFLDEKPFKSQKVAMQVLAWPPERLRLIVRDY
jgi:hypothetical protein